MTRRRILACLGAAALSGRGESVLSQGQEGPSAGWRAWTEWKARFLTDAGRVVDSLQQESSHSEGQGYGLLLAQAFGDEAAFRAIEGWTARHLAIRQDALMAWRWFPGRAHAVPDWHNATDGDLFRAWALLQAARDSGWEGTEETARAIARDLATLCLAPDPRAASEPVLLPGAEGFRDAGGLVFNPSYVMSRALRELGGFAGENALVRAADHGETLLADLAARGPMPDWIRLGAAGFAPAPRLSANSGHDALRVPLYLVWSGRADHPAVASRTALEEALPLAPGHHATGISREGALQSQSDHPGYAAISALARCVRLPDPTARQPYYPATLHLMASVAAREGGADCG